jgi:hypothetical protein
MCAICQEEFQEAAADLCADPSRGDSDADSVALPDCVGHSFHRACLAAEIKMRGKCPLCATSI